MGTDHGYGYGYGYEAIGMGTGTGTGLRPWVWVRVRVRDHRYGYEYGYGFWYETIDMVRVRDHGYGYRYGYVSRMSSRGWKTVGITIATQHCTWVPHWIWDFVEESHCVTRPCETIPPLSMLCVGILLASHIATSIDWKSVHKYSGWVQICCKRYKI